MKKRLLPLLLVIALLVALSVVAVGANETPATETTKQMWSHLTIAEDGQTATGYCPHCCDDPTETVEWTLYTRTSGHNNLYTGGHYFLNESTESNGALQPYAENLDFVLHLNGHTYKRYSKDGNNTGVIRPYKNNTTFSIVDDQAQAGALDGDYGWVVNANSKTGTKVVLYSGSLTSNVTTVATSGTNTNGGTIRLTAGTFEMYGGTVNGTKAVNGGAIYASGTGTAVKIHGGTVNGGSATSYGGAIYSDDATVEISGGLITGGTSAKCGGNLFHSDSNGITISGGTVTGGIADDRGGNIYISAVASNLTISGGTVSNGQALAKGTVDLTGGGGNIYVNHGKMDIVGGTISGGQAKLGGNICTNIGSNASDKTAYIGEDNNPNTPAIEISGGYASSGGGNIYAAEALEIGTCTIKEGEAYNGGNIYAKKALTVGAATISDGDSSNGGGNIMCAGETSLTGTVLTGGQAKYGGSIAVTDSGNATIAADISGGVATSRGGNIYMFSTTSALTITGGSIKDGVCLNDNTSTCGGGNIYTNNGVFTLSGGVVSGGKAVRGGNIFTNTGASAEANTTIINGTAVIKDGEAETYGGNLYCKSNMTLGAVTFENGAATYGDDIYIGPSANLTVDAAYNGEAMVYYSLNQLPNPIPGGMVCANKNKAADAHIEINRNTGVFTGKLYLENDPTLPFIYAKENDDKLYITGVALIGRDGNYTWFVNNQDAVAAYNADTAYMQVMDGALPLTGGDYVVDLAGSDVAITGTGNVTVFDSANADYATYGTATIDGPVLRNTFKTTVENQDTYMVEAEGVYSFHQVGLKIVGVSVRTGIAGMYYTGKWQCDDLLAKKIATFGVAVSVRNQPGMDFATDADTLYTRFEADAFVSGAAKNGVMIADIVKGTSQNTLRSKKDIYATAYITFLDGSVAISGENVAYSLYDTLKLVEDNIYDYAADVDNLNAFCQTWKANGANWDMDFTISDDAKQLHTVYAGRLPYHGEAHDHGATGGNSDGNYTLGQWKAGMESLGMDFATLVDHRQVNHMYLPEWDTNQFIGGSEASTKVQGEGYETDKNKMHYNMIFTDPKGLEAVVSSFAPFNYRYSSTKGIYEFSYPDLTPDQIREVIQLVKDNGGMFTHVHPKSSSYIQSDDPLMYWFADWTGLEVFYGYSGYAPEMSVVAENYQLWVDLLAAGKYVWATAGSDKHAAPNTNALTTIYAEQANANSYFSHMKVGDTTCGPVGIRMCMGDSLMGSQTDFEGKRLVFCVDDFHEVAYDATHTYHVELISDTGVVYSTTFDASQPFYYGMDADDSAKFYRVEVFDDTLGLRIAIGNPIWNDVPAA